MLRGQEEPQLIKLYPHLHPQLGTGSNAHTQTSDHTTWGYKLQEHSCAVTREDGWHPSTSRRPGHWARVAGSEARPGQVLSKSLGFTQRARGSVLGLKLGRGRVTCPWQEPAHSGMENGLKDLNISCHSTGESGPGGAGRGHGVKPRFVF